MMHSLSLRHLARPLIAVVAALTIGGALATPAQAADSRSGQVRTTYSASSYSASSPSAAHTVVQPAVQAAYITQCVLPAWVHPPVLTTVGGVSALVFYTFNGDGLFIFNSFCSIGSTKFIMQSDGNLVVYVNGAASWGSNTVGAGHHTIFQGDGNLVVYRSNNTAVCGAPITLSSGNRLAVRADGHVVIYNSGWSTLWSTPGSRCV